MSVAWVGAGIAAVGAYSSYSSAQDQLAYNQNLTDEDRQAQQNMHDEWQATYGELATNLSDYYNSISAESYAAMGLENASAAFETSMKSINESLAQRGITNTAVAASIGAQAELDYAEQKAAIRSTSETLAMQEKLNFLSLGLNQDQGKDYGYNSSSSSSSSSDSTASIAKLSSNNSDNDSWGGSNTAAGSNYSGGSYSNTATSSDATGHTTDDNDDGPNNNNPGDWGA